MNRVPYKVLDLLISSSNKTSVLELLSHVRPAWPPEKIKFHTFTEGCMNTLFMCYTESAGRGEGVVVRIFGERTEIFVNRENERMNMQVIHRLGLGAPLYAQFNNG